MTTGLVSAMRFGSLGPIIIGTQLDGNPAFLGPAIVFTMLDLVLPFLLAIELGRRHPISACEWGHRAVDELTAIGRR